MNRVDLKRLARGLIGGVALTLAVALGLASAPADALTIAEIQKKGSIKIALSDVSPPYATMNDKMEHSGLEVEMAQLLAKALNVKLEVVIVTAANRVACLLTECADLLIYGLTITPERATQVWFSQPYVANSFGIVGPKGLNARSAQDLTGKRVGVIRAAFGDPILTKAAPSGTTIQRYEDMSGLLQAQLSGQVDMIAENALIPGVLNSMKPGGDFETKFSFTVGYWGIAMRQDQMNLLQWVNSWLLVLKMDGELERLHQKYLKISMPFLPTF
jgi:polar amino acid transport system substrate-binding protein